MELIVDILMFGITSMAIGYINLGNHSFDEHPYSASWSIPTRLAVIFVNGAITQISLYFLIWCVAKIIVMEVGV